MARSSGDAPRETTFQAFTLLGRVNQLRLEITGIPAPLIQVSLPPEVRPFDAWQVVNAAYEQILEVKRELRISEQIEERTSARSATPATERLVEKVHRMNQLIKRGI